MKNDLAHLESPFLSETIVEGEPPPDWESAPQQAYELDLLAGEQAFDALREQGDDELEHRHDHEGFGAAAWLPGYETEYETDHEIAHEAAHEAGDEAEDEAPCCAANHELADLEAELFDSEAWSGSAEQLAFRDRVLAAHLARSRSSRGAPQRDLNSGERAPVPGTNGIEMGSDAAAAAGRLLAAANADLAKAQQAGDADALRTVRITATSGYRASDHQRKLWLKYFPGYYKRTRAAREGLADGPHSEAAVTYMLKPTGSGGFGLGGRIAAPGYSNHQNGIAIDLWQERKKGHEVPNDSGNAARKKWHDSWFHGWLKTHAENLRFKPIPTEEWHWEYLGNGSASGGTRVPAEVPAPSPASSPAGSGTPAAELTRFAQRVLNAVEGEHLTDDGDFGPRTRAALERFRLKHALGGGSALDAPTELALAQRALEELAQASMFAQAGRRDARTDQELLRFKSARGLGMNAQLDAATRRALTDALAARTKATSPGTTSPAPASSSAGSAPSTAPATPTAFLGGKLWTFRARVVATPVAVFCPPAAVGKREVEVLVFAHGLLHGCERPRSVPDGLITGSPFRLGSIVAASNRPIVLVVPLLDWANPGSKSAFGASYPRWHALARPAHLNALVDEALAELGRVQSVAPPAVSNLVVAGHSRAYDFMEPLAHLHTDPQMQQGALARLSQVWSLDATYDGNVANWQAWLRADPQLRVQLFYRRHSKTAAIGDKFYAAHGGRLSVTRAPEGHCALPGKRLPGLLAGGSVDQEAEGTWGEDESGMDERADGGADERAIDADHYGPDDAMATETHDEAFGADDLLDDAHEVDEEYRPDDKDEHEEPDDLEYGFEALQESADDEYAPDEEAEFEFEDEDHAEQALEEEETGDKTPMAVPGDNPVPFAPLPAAGSHWPVCTKHKSARMVSYMYQAPSGIVGKAGRMFLAGRKGKVNGRTVGRWHAGLDLFAYANDVVVACEAGRIVSFSHFYKANSGQDTYKLLIEHEASGIVINYGEVRKDSLSKNGLKVGMRVSAGQPIGWVSDTKMLHFEAYVKGTTDSQRWWKSEKNPPRELLNPTRYLLELARTGLTCAATGGVRPAPVPASAPTHAPSASAPQSPATPSSGRLPTLSGLGAGQTPPSDLGAYRKFRLTTYHVVDQADEPTGSVRIPILDDQGRKIAECSPAFFAKLSLEGTGRLTGDRLVNVTGNKVTVSHDDYAAVLDYHRKAYAKGDRKRVAQGKKPAPTVYSGIVEEGGRVVQALSFHEVAASKRGVGYGMARNVAYTPFRTLAADIGTPKYAKVDPAWKGKGGLVPPGTHVYIKEYDGMRLPDGSTHDGWFIVNDTGGAIFGAHFDVFTGSEGLRKQVRVPAFGQIWFAGIEQRIPAGYAYGIAS